MKITTIRYHRGNVLVLDALQRAAKWWQGRNRSPLRIQTSSEGAPLYHVHRHAVTQAHTCSENNILWKNVWKELKVWIDLTQSFILNGIWWFVVVVVFVVPTIQYSTTVQKLFENSFRRFRSRSHALSSGLTSKNASKKNSPQAAKETAHVNAISYQSFLWVFVNEFMSSIVSTNAEGRLLESAEERSRITQLIVVANYEMRWTR